MKKSNKEQKFKFMFSEPFKPYRRALRATEREFIKIWLSPNGAVSCSPFNSKLGGVPYLPKDASWPVDSENDPLCFFAQINFEEIPPLADYPKKGIVQFFNSAKLKSCLGSRPDIFHDKGGYRIIFYKDIETDLSKLKLVDSTMILPEEIKEDPDFPFPLDHCYKMNFNLGRQMISSQDYRIENILPLDDEFDWLMEYEELCSEQKDAFNGQIGGYPHFCQEDPRGWIHEAKEYELLFQLTAIGSGAGDVEKNSYKYWGDIGVSNWFIKPSDLKEGNFSNVFFNWDCT